MEIEEKVCAAIVEAMRGAVGAFTRKEKAQQHTVEAFQRSSDYLRDLNEAVADSFLMGFEDCRMKVL